MSALPVKDRPRAAAVPAGEARQQLLDHRRAGRRDAFIDLAYRYLAAVPKDPPIALDLLRALVELGLGDPARELLETSPDLRAADDAAALRGALESLPAAVVPWAALRQRFAANLDACLASRPHLHPLRADLAAAVEGLELLQTTDGALHLGRRRPGLLREWVPGFGSGGADTVALPMDAAGPAVAVIGTALSPLAQRVHAATRPDGVGPSAPLFVLDDDLGRTAAWLHALDLADLLADERVGVFLGPQALPDYERYLLERDDLLLPEVCLVPPWAEAAGREAEAVARRVAERRGRGIADHAARLAERAGQRSISDWAARLRPPATVLGFTSRATTMLQYSMRDIGHAVKALGYDFRLVIERGDHCRHTMLTTSRAVWETDPALIVLINHFRHEQPQALGAGPLLSWIQDPTDVVLSKRTGESIGPLDFVCGYYSKQCIEEFHFPREQFQPIRFFPVSCRTFHNGAIRPHEEDDLACDIIYVGHQLEPPASLRRRFRSRCDARYHPLLDHLDAVVTEYFTKGQHLLQPEATRIVPEAAKSLGLDVPEAARTSIAHFYAYRLFDTMYREQTLEWVSAWAQRTGRRFRLHGRGWETHPSLGRWAGGSIPHGPRLRKAYRAAKLAIQPIPTGFKHQRTFEALASGALVLTRYSPNDYELLSVAEYNTKFGGLRNNPGTPTSFPLLDRVVFHDREEFEQHAESFLRDPAAREELQSEFRRTTVESFTYDAIVPQTIARIRSELIRAAQSPPVSPEAGRLDRT